MKLASLKQGRDGKLVVVDRSLTLMVSAESVAPNLQAALDDWVQIEPKLRRLYQALNNGDIDAEKFQLQDCASPLPRAYQWADASAYVNHVALVRKARGAEIPESFWTDPLMYQGGSDSFLNPTDAIRFPASEPWGLDFEAEVAVVTDDVPSGVSIESAPSHIKLLMLVNDVSLRDLIPGEVAKGFGFFQSKPASAFSPVAVTPDELAEHWRDTRVHLPLLSYLNKQLFGKPNAGVDMTFNFAELIVHAAKTRHLGAGTIIGSGTVSNRQSNGPGVAVAEGGLGYSCIAEQRMVEILSTGSVKTPFLRNGDRVQIEMLSDTSNSIFGTIDQVVQLT